MPSRLEIVVDGDELLGVRDETISLEQVADGGEIGSGGFDREDDSLSDVPAWKDVTVEDARADTPRLFNALLESVVLESSDAKRPAETDYARVSWLLSTSDFAAIGVAAGVVPNTNTVNLDASDYRREAGGARRVLSDCAEAAQKNYFIYDYGAGAKLYYDKHTGTSLSSTLKLSTVRADVDEAEVFWILDGAERKQDPSEIWSKVVYNYDGGHVTRTDTDAGVTTSSDFRRRETVVDDSTVKSSAKATAKADKYLVAASNETVRFTCSTELPAQFAGEIQAGMRIQIKVPHLGYSAFTWFRITRCVLQLAETTQGVSREAYRLNLEFAADVKITSFNDSRPGDDVDTATTTDGSAITLSRYQMSQETGSGQFGPAAGLWENIAPDFDLNSLAGANDGVVSRAPEGNISHSYTDCGVGTGAVAGLESRAVWHRFTIDLSDGDVMGVRVTVAPFLTSGSGYTESPGGFLDGADTVIVGIHTGADSSGSEVTDQNQYTPVGTVGASGGEVVIPSSLLIDVADGYNWIVLAPNWNISSGLLICNDAGNKPWGYGNTGHDTNASSIVSAVPITFSGSGLSPWLPAIGAVDGTNDTFSLPLWNGNGLPELRVGNAILTMGEYTVDSGALEATLTQPPPADMAGQVFYRAETGG
jgi:hypothetical protein